MRQFSKNFIYKGVLNSAFILFDFGAGWSKYQWTLYINTVYGTIKLTANLL